MGKVDRHVSGNIVVEIVFPEAREVHGIVFVDQRYAGRDIVVIEAMVFSDQAIETAAAVGAKCIVILIASAGGGIRLEDNAYAWSAPLRRNAATKQDCSIVDTQYRQSGPRPFLKVDVAVPDIGDPGSEVAPGSGYAEVETNVKVVATVVGRAASAETELHAVEVCFRN